MKLPDLHRFVIQRDVAAVANLLASGRVDLGEYDATGKTALMHAAGDLDSDTRILDLLVEHGANLEQESKGDLYSGRTAIGFAVSAGDPRKVTRLIDAGASIHFCDPHGYDAMLYAVHHRDIARDTNLIDLLRLLISHDAALNTVTKYRESALRVLSRVGRFDAIELLLEAGADEEHLNWSALHRATALGTVDDVKKLLESGHATEERDWWERTPWLLAILTGDVLKVQVLQAYGANVHARGRCGETPLTLAVTGHHAEMLRWLIDNGQDVQQVNQFGATALFEASLSDDVVCARVLLDQGAHVDHLDHIPETALSNARSPAMAQLLLNAGADIRRLTRESRRGMLGLPPDPNFAVLSTVSAAQFARGRNRQFGRNNPEVMNEPFWLAMIQAGVNGYSATQAFNGPSSFGGQPVWCADRFGQSFSFLPDGRIVQIGGEHEDSYDPDFCIYNDVFVHAPDGAIVIYGYPEAVFPPTDFHSSTVIGNDIYIIGRLGYYGAREYGSTPVYRLSTETFEIDELKCSGEAPGWIYDHRATQRSPTEIEVRSGKILTWVDESESHSENERTFVLDVKTKLWRKER